MDGSFHGSRSAGTERDQVGHHHVRPVVGRHDHQCPTRDRFQGIKVKQLLFHTPAYDAFPLHFTGNFASDIFNSIFIVKFSSIASEFLKNHPKEPGL